MNKEEYNRTWEKPKHRVNDEFYWYCCNCWNQRKIFFFFQYFMNIYSKPRSLKKYAKTLISDVTIFLPGAIEWTKEWIKKKWVTVKTSRREENMRRNISKFCQILFMFSFTLSIYALSLSSHTFSNEKIIYLNASGKFNICIYLVLLEFLENIV